MADVHAFRIVQPPAVFWQKQALNPSRKKFYAKAYEIVCTFRSGEEVRDRLVWRAKGAGRDCFVCERLPYCLKAYTEMQYNTNETDFEGARRWQPRAPQHLPRAHARQLVTMQGQSSGLQKVDALLVDYVGTTLTDTLVELCPNDTLTAVQTAQVAAHLVAIVRMTETLHGIGLVWNEDFHSGNIAWNRHVRQWYMIDLETWAENTSQATLRQEWQKAGKRLQRDTGGGVAGTYFRSLLKHVVNTHTVSSHELAQTLGISRAEPSAVDVEAVAFGSVTVYQQKQLCFCRH